MVTLQPLPILLGERGVAFQPHVIFQVRALDRPRDGVVLEFGDVLVVGVHGIVRQQLNGGHDFLREPGIAQLLQGNRRVLDHIVEHRRDPGGFAVLAEHQAKGVQDVRCAGFVPLTKMCFHCQEDCFVETRHDAIR